MAVGLGGLVTARPDARVDIDLAVPRPADRSQVAEDRSAGGIRDQTGPEPPDAHEIAHGTHRDTPGRTGTGWDDALASAEREGLVEARRTPGTTPRGKFKSRCVTAMSPPGSCPPGSESPRTGPIFGRAGRVATSASITFSPTAHVPPWKS
jgi:hypothetical protein